MKTFSDRLKHARLLRGHTQKALARLVRISQSAIGSYESGLRHSSRSARKLAQVLKIEVEWLETGKGPMELPLDAYDLSNTLPVSGVSESAPRPGGRPRPLAPWPYPNISPSQFESLTPDERAMLEALTQTFIETTLLRRGIKPRGRKIG
ncbi:helix-turn-helix domain-containing protein [Achromobacter mucicolens]|uniref:Helix-turn-helix domain-containing protein n=1 Tax=Achromobacter mucicolens TaxID=1389922 RepID=A0ABD4YVS2_9BURK|nr:MULTISPECIES: helix-turn-helix transcriptional regulator [Achromobacter]OAE63592.1 transcriptional regulator [Achromobacter xylosoxidans]MCP2518573.1 helix-turn-helix domain-containing protein [Achromobacter mucicolens]MCU6615961.1 helix-turn-helix domain-containing protein [Achromobacter mucicolens]MDG9967303.1 helix-turn-helix domain-containing protein [Achromobacter mucicolens]MDH1179366.1 helix-turn-helix domain-containing protein [Achromobacter mucicolens]